MDYKGEPKTATEVIHLLLADNRPFEARISGQPHLPFIATRSNSPMVHTPQKLSVANNTREDGREFLAEA